MSIQPKVFISHSSKDHHFIDWLDKKLNKDNISTWRDENILLGDSITLEIENNLKDSNFFLIVLSPSSLVSPWVQQERGVALMRQINSKGITIIPILLGLAPDEMPILLQDKKAARFDVVNYEKQESEYVKIKDTIADKTKASILQKYQDTLLANFAFIDSIISKSSPVKLEVENILKLLKDPKRGLIYQDYFFSKVIAIHWFELIQTAGLFITTDVPSPQLADKEGYYSFPQWNALTYLEKIAQQLKKLPATDQAKYEDELLGIIRAVSQKRQEILSKDPDSIELDNYRTWFTFAKILACLPKEKISKEIIDLFEIWIESKFDSALAAVEIFKNILPKFLGDNATSEDIAKAEQITEIMLKSKEIPGQKSLSVNDGKEFRLMVNDYWISDAYIKRGMAVKLGQKCSKDFIFKLAGQLKKIIGHKNNHHLVVEHENQEYLLVISRAESKFICELKKRAKPEQKDFILNVASFEGLIPKSEPFECQNASEFKEKVSSVINNHNLPDQVIVDVASELEGLYAHLWDDYTYIQYRSLGDRHEHGEKAEGVLIYILRDILNAKAKVDPSEARAIFKKFMSDEYRFSIFTRLVIYCYDKNYETYRKNFWELVESRKNLLFGKSDFESEIHNLLKHNINKFTTDEQEKIAETILAGPFANDYTEIQKTYWRQKWYSALDSDPEFQKKYDECRKKTGAKEFINFRDSHVRSGWGKSPLTKEDILRMSNSEIARFILEFEAKPKDPWNDPTPEALADMIQQVAAENPKKFTDDLMPFINTGYRYVYSILTGFWDYLNKGNADFGWKNALGFIEAYINRDDFWANKFMSKDSDIRDAKHDWVVSAAANLMQIGTQTDDAKAIPPEFHDKVWEITDICMTRVVPEEPSTHEEADPVGKSLNSTEGKWIRALLYLSLRITRLQGKDSPLPRWKSELKAAYEDILTRKLRDAYTIFGEYVSNFYYLDKEWTLKKIEEFKNLHPNYWEAFMTGYFYSSHVYDDFYGIMFNHYKKAIVHKFADSQAGESLAQHLAIFYLRGLDGLKEGNLLYNFIRSSDKIRIERLIGYLWMQRPDPANTKAFVMVYDENELKPKILDIGTEEGRKLFDASINKKIIELWKYLIDFYRSSGIKDDSDKEIVSSLAKLALFLPKLDAKNVEWLKTSAPYLGLGWNISFVFEYLIRLKDIGVQSENAKYLADIFLEITEHFLPDYKEEYIEELLEFIFKTGNPDEVAKAKEICNRYASKGRADIIRKVWETYRDA